MHNPTLSRRDFLKTSGSLVVAFSFGAVLQRSAMADAATGKAFSLDQQDRDVVFASGVVGGGDKLLHDSPWITRVFLSNSENMCGSE